VVAKTSCISSGLSPGNCNKTLYVYKYNNKKYKVESGIIPSRINGSVKIRVNRDDIYDNMFIYVLSSYVKIQL